MSCSPSKSAGLTASPVDQFHCIGRVVASPAVRSADFASRRHLCILAVVALLDGVDGGLHPRLNFLVREAADLPVPAAVVDQSVLLEALERWADAPLRYIDAVGDLALFDAPFSFNLHS